MKAPTAILIVIGSFAIPWAIGLVRIIGWAISIIGGLF